ncbi:DUF3696 domain-containing protein [Candidatus Sumerlaeota bacterium]|nr:DUF3696 domain-containing protein [Candidatus Sumerlaeota bacterium]
MERIIIEGVRCFQRRQSASLKPVTILIGENSTGKTTFLALVRIAWDLRAGNFAPDFNEEPFELGAYDQIASYRGGKEGCARTFTIESEAPFSDYAGGPYAVTVCAEFGSRGSQPNLETWRMQVGQYGLKADYGSGTNELALIIFTPSGSFSEKLEIGDDLFRSMRPSSLLLPFHASLQRERLPKAEKAGQRKVADVSFLSELAYDLQRLGASRPYAFAPIRTRPKRTYDPIKDVPEPGGSHVPMVLAKTLSPNRGARNELRETLDKFGKDSGLFHNVEVRRLGRTESDPFQIRIKVAGPAFNLIDVGYGVSQVLPIIVDCLRAPKGATFLLQQPEVHLHPRAQAELGSFLAFIAKEQKKRVIIETHSDYIVDRIRMDIREGKHHLNPDDVALLYFERDDGGVTIHELRIDEQGNILNPPRGYRQFFLDEERKLLGC